MPGVAVLVLCVGAGPVWASNRQSGPWQRYTFDQLGVPGLSASFLRVGSSLLTLDFLDDSHLLVTFGTRGLVPRLPDDPATDDDRMVAGEVVEIPSGKILARTEWHMHDHGRYLWNLGNGRFLLRIRNSLSVMAPLANLKTGKPFARVVFPFPAVPPAAVLVSPDGAIVTVEARLKSAQPEADARAAGASPVSFGEAAPPPTVKVLAGFYRVGADGSAAGSSVGSSGESGPGSGAGNGGGVWPPKIEPAGAVRADMGFVLPADGDGYLWATETARNHWAIDFDEFGGGQEHLTAIDSSCGPILQLVSHSEFVALSCQGNDDDLKLMAFGFDGHETWEEPFNDISHLAFAFAPRAGRFAISRTSTATPTGVGLSEDVPAGPSQNVRVYQTESGDLLLNVHTEPAFSTAENFDLAPAGRELAVVSDGAVEVYKLPALSKRDVQDLALVNKFAPPTTEQFSIARITHDIEADADKAVPVSAPAPAAAAPPVGLVVASKAATPAAPDAVRVKAAGGAKVSDGVGASDEIKASDRVKASNGAGAAEGAKASDGARPPDVVRAPDGVSAAGDGQGVTRKPPSLLNPGESPEYKPGTPQA